MEQKEFMDKYALKLNENQKKAVQAVDGPVLLLAVPGSGKTTVLVTRLGYMLLCKGILPENIVTLTYTVPATKDMARRFVGMFGDEYASRMEFRTINGICQKIILQYAKMAGKDESSIFRLLTDEKENGKILSDILVKIMDEYPTESDVKGYKTLITYCKNMMLSEDEIKKLGEEEGVNLFEAYDRYNRYLVEHKLMDYDDQLIYAYRLLKNSPSLLGIYRDKYRYICVDEAQDTSKIQHSIISLLAGKEGNLFMVGDEDQSIYGFRAAYPEALLNFGEEHPSALILVMDNNYRSNSKIVDAADRFIQHNTDRYEKHMIPTKDAGTDIRFIELNSRQNQYSYLMKVADGCQTETAVLYRDNESVLPLADMLDRQGITYCMKSKEMTFFTSRVVTDVVNILKFALNPRDTDTFMKIYFKCQTFLKKAQAEEICRISVRDGIPVLSAAEMCGNINGMVLGKCRALSTNLTSMIREKPDKALFRIENPMGYGEYLERKNMDENKMYILKMLAYNEDSVKSFLDRLAYLQERFKNLEPDFSQKFILSTIHSSKGLEYDRVFMMDVCDGIFPGRSPKAQKLLWDQDTKVCEEERRLFYVGITRAKNELDIFTFKKETSQFVKELRGEKESLKSNYKTGTYIMPATSKKNSKFSKKIAISQTTKPDYFKNEISKPESSVRLIIGMRVVQDRYGAGTVTDTMFKDGRNEGNFEVTYDSGEVKRYHFPTAFVGGMRLKD